MIRYIKTLSVFFLLAPSAVLAQDPVTSGLDTAAQGTGLLKRSAPEIISGLIRVALTLMGTVFTVLILLGGFRWMTSGGSPEKIKEAKAMIINAAIGLLIVLASYVIVRFVLDAILNINKNTGDSGADAGG